MKKHRLLFAASAMLLSVLCFAGCSLLQDHQDEIRTGVIRYAETQGLSAAITYVDKLVEEGKLSKEQGDKIKAAIPQGIEKLKETINVQEEENVEE